MEYLHHNIFIYMNENKGISMENIKEQIALDRQCFLLSITGVGSLIFLVIKGGYQNAVLLYSGLSVLIVMMIFYYIKVSSLINILPGPKLSRKRPYKRMLTKLLTTGKEIYKLCTRCL